MSTLRNPRKPDDGSGDVLTDATRRRIVRLVRGLKGAVPERKLAERLATTDSSPKSEADAGETIRSYRIRLRHVHLPKLVEAGLVEWDEDVRTVESSDTPPSDIRRLETSVPTDERDQTDPLPGADRRREVLAIVDSAHGPISRERLARELASRDADGRPTETRVEEVTVRLHHRHIPKLREAGLVEYDRDAGTVECA